MLNGEKPHTMAMAMDSEQLKSRIRVTWDGRSLNVTVGDEIEILRGIIMRDIYPDDIRATMIKNLTSGAKFRSRIEGVMMSESPKDIDPPIRGYVQNLEVSGNTTFELVRKGPEPNLIRLYNELITHVEIRAASEVHFKGGQYRSAIFDSWVALESMIKQKIRGYPDESIHSLTTTRLMRKVFNLENPILTWKTLENTDDRDEYAGYSHIFAGSMLGIRNPKAHNLFQQTPMRGIRLLCLANLLAEIIDLSGLDASVG